METINNIRSKLPTDYRIYLAILLVVFIAMVYFSYKKGLLDKYIPGGKTTTQSKKKPKKQTKRNAKSLSDAFTPEKQSEEKEDDIDEETENIQQDAEKLYGLVHSDLARGTLTVDDFKARVGDLGDENTYINLSQLYNITKEEKKDPNEITAKNYEMVLNSDL